MTKQTRQTALTVVVAVIGAGFASGWEIVSFFSQYGRWSWLGIAAASLVIGQLTLHTLRYPGYGGMPEKWQGRWQSCIWHGLFGLLMLSTGGAMLSAGGEVIRMLIPGAVSGMIGVGVTSLVSLALAGTGQSGSARVSWLLVGLLTWMAAVGLVLPVQQTENAALLHAPWQSIWKGTCYAGFNMALAIPGLAEQAKEMTGREQRACAVMAAAILTGLLAAENGLMLRHSALQKETMPMLKMISESGNIGRIAGIAGMYLAVLTTACAVLRGLWALGAEKTVWRLTGWLMMNLCAMLGFAQVVECVYPLLGMGCLGMILWGFFAKMEKNA